jgi:hypothetical protein
MAEEAVSGSSRVVTTCWPAQKPASAPVNQIARANLNRVPGRQRILIGTSPSFGTSPTLKGRAKALCLR